MNQAQAFDLPLVFGAGGEQVEACGFDGAVAEKIGEFDDVVIGAVKAARKEMAQVVRKDFGGRNAGFFGKGFHFRPNLFARERTAASGAKEHTGGGFLFSGVFLQFAAEFARQENGADFAFEGDVGTAGPEGFYGDVA